MKTAIKTASTAIHRAVLWFQIRSVEIHIYGIEEAMTLVRDPLTLGNMQLSRHLARGELARLRSEYSATFRPGVRRVWGAA